MNAYQVQLEPHDDVLSTRDKISWSQERRVLLVWPRAGGVLERRIDLLLLLRYCQELGAQLAVVSGHAPVRANARSLGIPVFSSTVQAERLSWRTVPGLRGRWDEARRASAARARAAGDLRARRAALPRAAELPVGQRLGVFLIGLLGFAVILAALGPSATVELVLERREQALALAGWADPALDAPTLAGGLPAQEMLVEVEGQRSAAVTGSARFPADFASGLVTFENLSAQELVLPRGSVVRAADGSARSHTTSATRIPAGARLRVAVVADQPGSAGNAPAGAINVLEGPLGFALRIENETALAGGGEQLAPAPGRAEVAALREALLGDLRETALAELRARAGNERLVLPGSLALDVVLEEIQDPPAGQPSINLQLRLRARFRALSVAAADWQHAAGVALDAALPAGWQPVAGSLQLLDLRVGDDVPGGSGIRWQARVARQIEPAWDRFALRDSLRGKSPQQAALALQDALPLAEPPRIEISPPGWRRMPLLPFQIVLVMR